MNYHQRFHLNLIMNRKKLFQIMKS